MKILVSNPSLQYTRNTVKALLSGGHEVVYATAYWYQPNRLFEKICATLFTPFNYKLLRYTDSNIPATSMRTSFLGTFLHFINKMLPLSVEQKSFWEDQIHDKWVSKLIIQLKPELVIGYEKSCYRSFHSAEAIGARKWLDLSQVHPDFIKQLRNKYEFFQSITGSENLFNQISEVKKNEYEVAVTIFCLSDFAANALIDTGIPTKKIIVNSLGFSPQLFFPCKNKSKKNIDSLKIIYAGIITKRKGVDLLLDVCSSFSVNEIQLTLIGPSGDAIHNVNLLSYKKNIQYIPFTSQSELAEEFRNADLFVFPSYLDSWAAVVPEAMACGLPVIVTTNTGAAQLVSAKNGIIIPPGNKEALQNAIQFFLDHPEERIQMGINAANTVSNHSWITYEKELLSHV